MAEQTDQHAGVADAKLAHAKLQNAIRSGIAGSGATIRQRVVDQAVEKAIEENSKKLSDGIGRLTVATRELRKLEKADVEVFDLGGTMIHSGYSAERTKQIKKARENRDKIVTALNLALSETADYSKLDKVLSSKPGEPISDE